eukprot:7161658-Alexandrium_andersonii.AAC.1
MFRDLWVFVGHTGRLGRLHILGPDVGVEVAPQDAYARPRLGLRLVYVALSADCLERVQRL